MTNSGKEMHYEKNIKLEQFKEIKKKQGLHNLRVLNCFNNIP